MTDILQASIIRILQNVLEKKLQNIELSQKEKYILKSSTTEAEI